MLDNVLIPLISDADLITSILLIKHDNWLEGIKHVDDMNAVMWIYNICLIFVVINPIIGMGAFIFEFKKFNKFKSEENKPKAIQYIIAGIIYSVFVWELKLIKVIRVCFSIMNINS